MLQLRLLELMYKLRPVKVTVLRSCEHIPFIESPIQKGSQITLPKTIAEVLEAHSIVEVAENLVSHQDIARVKFSHMQQRGSIPKIDEFFYAKVKDSIKRLLAKAKSEGDIVLLRSIEKIHEDFIDVSNIRLSTIVRAFQLRSVDVVEKSCTIEERVLINMVKSIYNKWIKEYIEFDYWGAQHG